MKAILSAEGERVLGNLARARALLAFDFDGTLAPIVADRQAAELRPSTRGLLRSVALLYPCAVISGRARADVAARVAGIPLFAVVGNHGAEAGRGPLDKSLRAQLLRWKRELEQAFASARGVEVEDKRFSLAVHYRAAPSIAKARRLVLRAATQLDQARVFGGHAVVNVVPESAPHKGTAIEELVRRFGRRPVLYAGDDRTDEDVFRAKCLTVGVRVGRTRRSAAAWYVPGQSAIDDLLEALIAARTRLDGVGGRAGGMARAAGL